jgi:hypothetical protein
MKVIMNFYNNYDNNNNIILNEDIPDLIHNNILITTHLINSINSDNNRFNNNIFL